MFFLNGPENAAPDEVVKDGVVVIFFAMTEGKVDLAAAIEGLIPGKGEWIGVGLRIGTHLFKAIEFGAIGGEERADLRALMVGEVALIGPGEVG